MTSIAGSAVTPHACLPFLSVDDRLQSGALQSNSLHANGSGNWSDIGCGSGGRTGGRRQELLAQIASSDIYQNLRHLQTDQRRVCSRNKARRTFLSLLSVNLLTVPAHDEQCTEERTLRCGVRTVKMKMRMRCQQIFEFAAQCFRPWVASKDPAHPVRPRTKHAVLVNIVVQAAS